MINMKQANVVRKQYQGNYIGYDTAMTGLKLLGFTEYAADQFLFAEVAPDQQEANLPAISRASHMS